MDEEVETSDKAVLEAALRFLARREHSAAELRAKLVRKGYPTAKIDAALAQLAAQNALSNARYSQEYCRARANRGYGPVRIAAELRQKGVDEAEVQRALRESEIDWTALAIQVARKHVGRPAVSAQERAKQWRTLYNRGFAADQIRVALGGELVEE